MIGFVNQRVWSSVVQSHHLIGVLLLLERAPLIPPVFFGHAKTTKLVARTDVYVTKMRTLAKAIYYGM